jgi:Icc-related predicted phosphoesterase
MRFGALGDIHGDFDAAARVMRRHPDVPFWLSVGDVGDDEGRYEAPVAPLYWIKGNNDNYDFIARGEPLANLHYIPNGTLLVVDGLRVTGLGGTFAPTWFETRAADLPAARSARDAAKPFLKRDDKRRHFVKEEFTACVALGPIDILLTHEAPRPFLVDRPRGDRKGTIDAGKTPINELLAEVKPRLHLFGHHHRFTESIRQGVRSVCLDLVSRSYLLVDRDTLHYTKQST